MAKLTLLKKKELVPGPATERLPLREVAPAMLAQLGADEDGVIRAVDVALSQAAWHRASDAHFEPGEEGLLLRYRIDGWLHDVGVIPREIQDNIIARIKVLARLVVYRKDFPQEGRVDAEGLMCGRAMRVATFPAVYGEKAVVRILDASDGLRDLAGLAFRAPVTAALWDYVSRPHGTLLLTGPSASGKTTTIYALLRAITAPDQPLSHVVTIEDPVEYRLRGISQTEVAPAAGFTFEMAVRSILRQDPDVIMIGEIRDAETARVAIQAGLTGHRVISTIHSGTAAGVFARLFDMGIEPFLAASSITAVLAQRLVRRSCPHCAEGYSPAQELLEAFALPLDAGPFHRGAGCETCEGLGFHGRTPLGEILRMDEILAECVLERARTRVLHALAVQQGMTPLAEDGAAKALEGLTTLEELQRVLPPRSGGAALD